MTFQDIVDQVADEIAADMKAIRPIPTGWYRERLVRGCPPCQTPGCHRPAAGLGYVRCEDHADLPDG